MRNILLACVAPWLVGGCAIDQGATSSKSDRSAEARLADTNGREVATAKLSTLARGVQVRIAATGLPQGIYAAHIHLVGRCDAPDFATAGGHWNPTGRQHGRDNPAGAHLGDLPNLTVGANGRGAMAFRVANARLVGGAAPILDADGAALMIHAKADDYRTDPSGASGARIACGVIAAS